jgi:methyl-accepting chemotaxis protein
MNNIMDAALHTSPGNSTVNETVMAKSQHFDEIRLRFSKIVVGLVILIYLASIVFFVDSIITTGLTQNLIFNTAGNFCGFVLNILVLVWLFRNRVERAGFFMLIGNIVILMGTYLFVPDNNAITGLTLALTLATFSGAGLPRRWTTWGIMAGLICGSIIMTYDYTVPWLHGSLMPLDPVIFVEYALILIMVFILFRSYSGFPLNAKLLMVGAGFSLLMMLGIFIPVYVVIQQISDVEMARSIEGSMVVAGAILIVVNSVLSLMVGRTITRPMRLISSAADKISAGDIHALQEDQTDAMGMVHISDLKRLELQSQDEISEVITSFNRMVAYQNNISGVIARVADGDLSREIELASAHDILGEGINRMILGLRSLVGSVFRSAGDLQESSRQLADSAEQAEEASNQITETIQQIARGISEQTGAIQNTESSVNHMRQAIDGVANGAREQSRAVSRASDVTAGISAAIRRVAENAHNSADGACDTAEIARNGARTVAETIQGMQMIKDKVGISAERVQEMGARSSQIGEILQTIDDIATQTNLVALNAAIEAARAGEHGKGFAVVADEVRKLAERSSNATKEIGTLIAGIQETVHQAVEAMNQGAEEVALGVQRASQSDDALRQILKAVEEVSLQVEGIAESANEINGLSNDLVAAVDQVSAVVEENSAATDEMLTNSGEVTVSVESIASVSEENSAAIEEVSAGTEEMAAQVEEVSEATSVLSEMAANLNALVARFKVGD